LHWEFGSSIAGHPDGSKRLQHEFIQAVTESRALFRLTIRDMLWLMVVVGVAVAWYCDRRYLAEKYAGEVVGKLLQIQRSDRTAERAKLLAD